MPSAHIVIIGGSFAGLGAAVGLDKDRKIDIMITVIEKRPFFHYMVGSPRAVVSGDYASQILVDYTNASTTRTKYVVGMVASVDAKSVKLEDGTTIAYDYLVIASGVKYASPFRFNSTSKEAYLAEFADLRNKLGSATNIALVGGGAANVELAAEIKTAFPNKSVTLIERSKYLAGANTNGYPVLLHNNVIKGLIALGVDVHLGNGVDLSPFRNDDGSLKTLVVGHQTLSVGSKSFDADLIIIAPGGYKPNTEFLKNGALASVLDAQGFVKVCATLQVPGHDNIYAVGDVTATGAPKTAMFANAQVDIAVPNLKKAIAGDSASKEKTFDADRQTRMMLVALGPTAAAGVMGGFSLPGFMGRMMKSKDLMWAMTKPKFFKA